MNFTAFKNDFYGKIKDFSVFDCMEFNLLKVVLDGLKVDYVSRGKVRTDLFSFYGKELHTARRCKVLLQNKNRILESQLFIDKHTGKEYPFLFLDNGRTVVNENGKLVSSYFQNILCFFQEKDIPFLHAVEVAKTKEIKYDLNVPKFANFWALLPFTSEEKELLAALKKKYIHLKDSKIFDAKELANIKYAFVKFFYEYKSWNYFFSQVKIKTAIFTCHYHKEGFILAAKRHGIKLYELQHGLIAPEDIFYIFPSQTEPVIERALFADKIFTYGDFWKQRLCNGAEYKLDKIVNLGYTMYSNSILTVEQKAEIETFTKGRKIILVTTQTFMHEYFIDYIRFLSNDLIERGNNEYCILVKKHPAEDEKNYSSLQKMPNVYLMNANTDALFTVAAYHISIYSTTLYDAVRYKVKSFAVDYSPFSDYVQSVVDSGVAQNLMPNENVLDKVQTETEINPTYYYHEPDFSLLLK